MGIRGLSLHLKQFASREQLHGRVVIDGPALAYHILWVARLNNVSNILDEPAYSVLGAIVAQWLDSLQSCGLEVAAIYFDGALPPYKKEERHRRISEKSREAHKYFLRTIPDIEASAQVPRRFLPDPPFLVPAILESLRSLERYRHLTSLVPGEADPYCADDVKRSGGILLTSDSDLLLYDLGPTGSVVFLKDVQLHTGNAMDAGATEAGTPISAPTYKQSELCRRMSLEPGQQSMLRVAFEMKSRPSYNLKGLPEQSKWAYLDEDRAKEFAAFVAEYQESPDVTGTALNHRSLLDPRISEFILDWAKQDTSETSASAKSYIVWLPSLVDRWDQASAWDPSTAVRQLAYSLYQGSESSRPTVMEYRRTLSVRSAGQAVELLAGSEVSAAVDGLVDYFDRFLQDNTVPRRLQWITTCLSLEIGHAAQEGKESNALGLWRKAAKSEGRLQPGNWDAVHLAAQILGALYSIRILQQVLTILKGALLPAALSSDQVNMLEQCLSSLPTIAAFPTAMDMKNVFEHLHQGGHLEVLSEATGVSDICFETAEKAIQSSETRQKKVRRKGQKHPKARASQPQASTNPFAALSTGN